MSKKIKILLLFFLIFISYFFFQTHEAKYTIEDIHPVAKINIDCSEPIIQMMKVTNSNDYSAYANKTHTISVQLKVIEKNIIQNNLSPTTLKIKVGDNFITPTFQSFSLVSSTPTEKNYEFSFTNATSDGSFRLVIPEGIIKDKSGQVNSEKTYITGIRIDNTPPSGSLKETYLSNGKSKAEISLSEIVRPISGWNLNYSTDTLSKEFPNPVSYSLPIIDYAQNSSEVLLKIVKPTSISVEYGTYDDYSDSTLVSNGDISSPNTISSNSICKTEAIFTRLINNLDSNSLLGKVYTYTHWGEKSFAICRYSELSYYYGYNPTNTSWFTIGKDNMTMYKMNFFTQFGGTGLNATNAIAANNKKPIPSEIAKQYLYGISGIQFKLADSSQFSIVYQSYVKGVGWLKASSDGQENLSQHNKPISAFRMNLVPKSEKTYLINYWNRDVGTNNVKK